MTNTSKRTKQDIINVAFDIVRKSGIEKVSAREIAKRLSCSIQPVFYYFNNMDSLKKELLKYSLNYYQKFLLDDSGNQPNYKQIGMNYIKFAKEESNLFKFIFMGDYHIKVKNFSAFDNSYTKVEETICEEYKIVSDKAEKIHLKMWMFTHGIACLVANGTIDFSDDEIKMLLTEEFQLLMKNEIK